MKQRNLVEYIVTVKLRTFMPHGPSVDEVTREIEEGLDCTLPLEQVVGWERAPTLYSDLVRLLGELRVSSSHNGYIDADVVAGMIGEIMKRYKKP